MKEERYNLVLDRYEKNIMFHALNALRSAQIKEERPTDPVEDLIIKVSKAPLKKRKVMQSRNNEER